MITVGIEDTVKAKKKKRKKEIFNETHMQNFFFFNCKLSVYKSNTSGLDSPLLSLWFFDWML